MTNTSPMQSRAKIAPWAHWTVVALCMLLSTLSHADSVSSECGFSSSASARPEHTSSCVFSQRQGFIRIGLSDGTDLEFEPVGDSPGNYKDAQGLPVYRRSGLGDEGVLFKLGNRFLTVLWLAEGLECSANQLAATRGCLLGMGGISFQLHAAGEGSIRQLRIQPRALTVDNSEIIAELDGTPYRAELADLDANGFPEIYIYVSSAGSGSYGSLVAYAVNNGKSVSPIYLPPLQQNADAHKGYQGHDEFAVVEAVLARRFPVYREGDTNAQPTGGIRQLQYRLQAGEAGWVLRLDKISEY